MMKMQRGLRDRAGHGGPRGSGRTTQLAKAAKALGATFIVKDERFAKYLRETMGDEAPAIMTADATAHGTPRALAVVYDHWVIEEALARLAELEGIFEMVQLRQAPTPPVGEPDSDCDPVA